METKGLDIHFINPYFIFKRLGYLWSRPHLARQSKMSCCSSCWVLLCSQLVEGPVGLLPRLWLTCLFYISRCWENPNPRWWLSRELGKGIKSTDPAEWAAPHPPPGEPAAAEPALPGHSIQFLQDGCKQASYPRTENGPCDCCLPLLGLPN